MMIDPSYRILQRRLILRDSLIFLVLTLITCALFGVTFLLFRSFSAHRQELAQRWSARGEQDLNTHHPLQAIADLRTALGYGSDEGPDQFLLAEALEQAGRTDEAYAYFSNLLESEPGSGPLNLQMARLSVKKRDSAAALHYYRAAIYGTWEGNDLQHRRTTRLELVRALLTNRDLSTARTELLIASEDTADDPASLPEIASLMAQTGDVASALSLYQAALAHNPEDEYSLQQAGNAAFNLGRYASARKFLERASRQLAFTHKEGLSSSSQQKLQQSTRILELFPAPNLPSAERASRIQQDATLIQNQLSSCLQQTAATTDPANELNGLDAQWKAGSKKWSPPKLRQDPSNQDEELRLIYATLDQTRRQCKASSGDDQLLQLISQSPETVLQ